MTVGTEPIEDVMVKAFASGAKFAEMSSLNVSVILSPATLVVADTHVGEVISTVELFVTATFVKEIASLPFES